MAPIKKLNILVLFLLCLCSCQKERCITTITIGKNYYEQNCPFRDDFPGIQSSSEEDLYHLNFTDEENIADSLFTLTSRLLSAGNLKKNDKPVLIRICVFKKEEEILRVDRTAFYYVIQDNRYIPNETLDRYVNNLIWPEDNEAIYPTHSYDNEFIKKYETSEVVLDFLKKGLLSDELADTLITPTAITSYGRQCIFDSLCIALSNPMDYPHWGMCCLHNLLCTQKLLSMYPDKNLWNAYASLIAATPLELDSIYNNIASMYPEDSSYVRLFVDDVSAKRK